MTFCDPSTGTIIFILGFKMPAIWGDIYVNYFQGGVYFCVSNILGFFNHTTRFKIFEHHFFSVTL